MYKVLLVDDEQIERMALARKIEKYYGDRVTISQAIDGRDAVRAFEQDKHDIIIMDISMPEMNGVMAAKLIRDQSSECSIIFLSAYDDFNYARNAIKVKALDYLLKPCDMSDLLAVMDAALHLTEEREMQDQQKQLQTQLQNQLSNSQLQQDEKEGEFIADDSDAIDRYERYRNVIEQDNESGSVDSADHLASDEEMNEARGPVNELAVAERMKQYVSKNYMNEISMQDAARELGYSDAYFSKLFKQYFNQNFTAYLTEYRVREAKRLLMTTNTSIKEISRMVGYWDSNYFAKIFKRVEGVIPSKYRENM